MGQDVDGLCRILREAGYTVLTTDLTVAQPRLGDLPNAAAEEVLETYRALGGVQPSPTLRPGSWDVLVDDVLVELDEQLHFNRYRSLTLTAPSIGSWSSTPARASETLKRVQSREAAVGCSSVSRPDYAKHMFAARAKRSRDAPRPQRSNILT